MSVNPTPPRGQSARTDVLRLCSYNVKTLASEADLDEIARCFFPKYHIVALQESRLAGTGEYRSDGFLWKWRGHTNGRDHGVCIGICEQLSHTIVDFEAISHRLLRIRIKLHKGRFASIFAAYAPTQVDPRNATQAQKDAKEEERVTFFNTIKMLLNGVNNRDYIFILGDFNAQVGTNPTHAPKCMGKFGVNHELSPNGAKLLDLCSAHELCLTNTFFKHRFFHTVTFEGPTKTGGLYHNQNDFIITRQRDLQYFSDSRAKRGLNIKCSDHSPVVATMSIRFPVPLRPRVPRTKVDTNMLETKEHLEKFQGALSSKLLQISLPDTHTVNDIWLEFQKAVTTTSDEVLRKSVEEKGEAPKRPWLSEDRLKDVQAKRRAFLNFKSNPSPEAKAEYVSLKNKLKKSLKTDRKQYFKDKYSELVECRKEGHLHEYYRGVKALTGTQRRQTMPSSVVRRDGETASTQSNVLSAFADFFQHLYNIPGTADVATIARNLQEFIPAGEGFPEWDDDEPTIQEVQQAIKSLKGRSAPGYDGMLPVLLKKGGHSVITWMHRLLVACWRSETVPDDWRKLLITAIHKKGSTQDLNNYRGIALLSAASKVYSLLILRRIQEPLHARILATQSGFIPERGTADHLFNIRQIGSFAKSHDKNVYAIFIDLKKAYDSVDREALWKVLEAYDLPPKINRILQNLYDGNQAAVKLRGKKSEWFPLNSGVKQGCVISPLLFNVFIDAVARLAFDSAIEERGIRKRGVRLMVDIGGSLYDPRKADDYNYIINHLLYADDLVILAASLEDAQILLTTFAGVCNKFGLTINGDKTEWLVFGRRAQSTQDSISLNSDTLRRVDQAKYLGAEITSDSSIEAEVLARLTKARGVFFGGYKKIFASNLMPRRLKIELFKVLVLPVLFYGAESWDVTDRQLRPVNTFLHMCLRRIFRVSLKDHVNTKILQDEARIYDAELILRVKRLLWLGHMERRNHTNICKHLLYSRYPCSVSPPGAKPQNFNKMICKDLKAVGFDETTWEMHGIPWRVCVTDKRSWKDFVEAAVYEDGIEMDLGL